MTSARRTISRGLIGLLVLGLVLIVAAFAAAPNVIELQPSAKRTSQAQPVASFSHATHTALQCFNCHPGLFTSPRARIDHASMKRGQYCGACHDGRLSTSIKDIGCGGCHVP